MIDKHTTNGILESIKSKVPSLDWDFVCKYHNGEEISIMELRLFRVSTTRYLGRFTYDSSSGTVIRGRYGQHLRFRGNVDLTDALLEVLSLESTKEKKIYLS